MRCEANLLDLESTGLDLGEVEDIIEGASGTFAATLRLPNPDRDLPAGLRCQVRFFEEGEREDEVQSATSDEPAAKQQVVGASDDPRAAPGAVAALPKPDDSTSME
jgi:hypothetical protein